MYNFSQFLYMSGWLRHLTKGLKCLLKGEGLRSTAAEERHPAFECIVAYIEADAAVVFVVIGVHRDHRCWRGTGCSRFRNTELRIAGIHVGII